MKIHFSRQQAPKAIRKFITDREFLEIRSSLDLFKGVDQITEKEKLSQQMQ
jgi:hypothetical protein